MHVAFAEIANTRMIRVLQQGEPDSHLRGGTGWAVKRRMRVHGKHLGGVVEPGVGQGHRVFPVELGGLRKVTGRMSGVVG